MSIVVRELICTKMVAQLANDRLLLEKPMRWLLVGPVPARIGLLDLLGILGRDIAIRLIALPARAGDAHIGADLQPLFTYLARVRLHARAGKMPPAPANALADAGDLLRRLVERAQRRLHLVAQSWRLLDERHDLVEEQGAGTLETTRL